MMCYYLNFHFLGQKVNAVPTIYNADILWVYEVNTHYCHGYHTEFPWVQETLGCDWERQVFSPWKQHRNPSYDGTFVWQRSLRGTKIFWCFGRQSNVEISRRNRVSEQLAKLMVWISQWYLMKLLSIQEVPMLRSVLQCCRLHLPSLLFRNMNTCGANTQTVI